MLGAQSLEQILGTSLMNMVPTEERKACQAFLDRAMGGQRGSFEVDLVGLTGSRHTFELHASAHPGAPDAIASVLISFRDVTESRRLEQSLVEAATRQAEQEAAHEAERKRLLTDMELARKAQTDQFAVDEQLTEFERRLAESNDERVALQKAHRRRDRPPAGGACRAAAAGRHAVGGLCQSSTATTSSSPSSKPVRRARLRAAAAARDGRPAAQRGRGPATDGHRADRAARGPRGERQHAVDTANSLRLDLDERHTLVADLTTRLQLLESDQQQTAEASAQLQRELESRTALANELAGRIETLEAEQVSLRAAADAELAALRSSSEAEQAAIRSQADAEKAIGRAEADGLRVDS